MLMIDDWQTPTALHLMQDTMVGNTPLYRQTKSVEVTSRAPMSSQLFDLIMPINIAC